MKRTLSIIGVALLFACQAKSLSGKSLSGIWPGSDPVQNQVVANRIVSLKPNITEILFALGVGDRVVGVTTWCHHPEAANALPKVADYLRPFPEQVLALHPDIVIGSEENSVKDVTLNLKKLGLPTAFLPFKTLEETYQSIQAIGTLVGKPQEAAAMVRQLRTQLNAVASHKRVRALAVVGYRPLIVVGHNTFLGELLEKAGIENVLTDQKIPYPHLNTEILLHLNPDIILDITMGGERSQEFWKQFPMLTAVKTNRVIPLDMDDFHAGPRLPAALATLVAQIQ